MIILWSSVVIFSLLTIGLACTAFYMFYQDYEHSIIKSEYIANAAVGVSVFISLILFNILLVLLVKKILERRLETLEYYVHTADLEDPMQIEDPSEIPSVSTQDKDDVDEHQEWFSNDGKRYFRGTEKEHNAIYKNDGSGEKLDQ